MESGTLYVGTIVHSLSLGELQVVEGGGILVGADGKIRSVWGPRDVEAARQTDGSGGGDGGRRVAVVDLGARLIVPGLVDAHVHAPQHSFVGTGMDLPLLDWLNKYTFPSESKFIDPIYAERHYKTAVARFLTNGTTTASYFGTIHLESTKLLADICQQVGQRSMVGKVNMDRNSPEYLVESSADSSASDTREFVEYVLAKQDPLVQPVITPRFVPSTSSNLMTALANISSSHDPKIRIQSHLSENKNEIEWVRKLHPDCDTYTDVYDIHGLLHDRSYMAHCVWCSKGERSLLRDKGVGIVHCPNSNFSLSSGALNVRRMLNEGLKVGLGSDVAGGYSPSMLDALRQAIIASKMVSISIHSNDDMDVGERQEGNQANTTGSTKDDTSNLPANGNKQTQSTPTQHFPALSYAEAFHLATQGGAECLSLGDTVGNFLPGKEFDALVVNPRVDGSPVDVFPGDSALEIFQRFLFCGDDRNIEQVFVKGVNRKTDRLKDMLKYVG